LTAFSAPFLVKNLVGLISAISLRALSTIDGDSRLASTLWFRAGKVNFSIGGAMGGTDTAETGFCGALVGVGGNGLLGGWLAGVDTVIISLS